VVGESGEKRRGAALPAAVQDASGFSQALPSYGRLFGLRRQSASGDGAFVRMTTSRTSGSLPSAQKAAWRCASRRTPRRVRFFAGPPQLRTLFWTAPAERQRRRSFRPHDNLTNFRKPFVRPKSGVALRFPPQSKTRQVFRRLPQLRTLFWTAPAERQRRRRFRPHDNLTNFRKSSVRPKSGVAAAPCHRSPKRSGVVETSPRKIRYRDGAVPLSCATVISDQP
jgi:hypothetical protein